MTNNPVLIILFAVIIVFMMLLDLGVVNKRSHVITNKEALKWTLIWVSVSMLFSLVVYWQSGFAKFDDYQYEYCI